MSDGLRDITQDFNRQMAIRHERNEQRARTMAEAAAHQLQAAQFALSGIQAMMEQFERALNADEEMMLVVIGGPVGEVIFPSTIEASGPDRLVFSGVGRDGQIVMVLQHVSQLNLMLKGTKVDGRQPRRVFELLPDETISHEP